MTHVTGFIYGPETQGRYLGEPVPMGLPAGAPSGTETVLKVSFLLHGMSLAEKRVRYVCHSEKPSTLAPSENAGSIPRDLVTHITACLRT